jgi:hypothetical protein
MQAASPGFDRTQGWTLSSENLSQPLRGQQCILAVMRLESDIGQLFGSAVGPDWTKPHPVREMQPLWVPKLKGAPSSQVLRELWMIVVYPSISPQHLPGVTSPWSVCPAGL